MPMPPVLVVKKAVNSLTNRDAIYVRRPAPLSDRKSTFISGSQKVFEEVSEITWMASGAPLRNRRIP